MTYGREDDPEFVGRRKPEDREYLNVLNPGGPPAEPRCGRCGWNRPQCICATGFKPWSHHTYLGEDCTCGIEAGTSPYCPKHGTGAGHLEEEDQRSPLELSRALQARLYQLRGVVGFQDRSAAQTTRGGLTEAIRFNVEAMHVELAELLNETTWKDWKTYPPDWYSDDRHMDMKMEAIDLYFFLNNLFIALGMSDTEIKNLYRHKFEINMERQEGAYK